MRTYTLTGGRTRPSYVLALDTVLEAGAGRLGPGRAEECHLLLDLCREHRRSVAELAGRLGRPATAVRVLISDLLDDDALHLPITSTYATSDEYGDDRPSLQLLAAFSAGLRKKFPDATSYAKAG
ncbi:DUF742 domain-containing protein [Streptomyces sp. NPDC048208]|uniref:DUF742 domain-containing protein n=1 Tax=Streptomyces sp. NPDC048208 TaxID=3365515 RepID=UPI003716F60C